MRCFKKSWNPISSKSYSCINPSLAEIFFSISCFPFFDGGSKFFTFLIIQRHRLPTRPLKQPPSVCCFSFRLHDEMLILFRWELHSLFHLHAVNPPCFCDGKPQHCKLKNRGLRSRSWGWNVLVTWSGIFFRSHHRRVLSLLPKHERTYVCHEMFTCWCEALFNWKSSFDSALLRFFRLPRRPVITCCMSGLSAQTWKLLAQRLRSEKLSSCKSSHL